MFNQTNSIEIPEKAFQDLMECNYFKKACEYYRIDLWEHYADVIQYMKQLAIEDIDEANQN